MNIKKKIILGLGLISLLAIGFIAFKIYSTNSRQKNISPQNAEGAKYRDLQPGVSSLNDVASALGPSVDERDQDGKKILEYKSNNPNFNNEVTIEEQKLSFIKQIVTMDEQITISEINKKYGNYEYILYGPLSTNGFDLYIYPSKGIAYIGHQSSGIILEIWYFPPTNLEEFKAKYASEYSESLPPRQ